jgi:group I intron endonuclease
MKFGIIYKHTNKVNGHTYIGSTIQDPRRRWRRSDKTYHSYKNCTVFFKALQKYGWDNFDTSILETNIPFQDLSLKEEQYINQYNSIAPNGYNTVKIIDGRVEYTKTTKDKISKSKIEYYKNLETPIIAYNRNHHTNLDGISAKQCLKCKTIKILTEFNKYQRTWDHLMRICKSCHQQQYTDYYEKNPRKTLDPDQRTISYKTRKTVSRPFIGTHIKTGELLIFKSGMEASRQGYDKTQIRRAILKSISYKDYTWKYGDEDFTKIFARKCAIKEVFVKEERSFLNKYHKQGYCQSAVCYGLYYQDELVCLLSFNKPRFNKNYQWEIIRLCSKAGTIVVGGASRLLSQFIKDINPASILTYADKVYAKQGDVYLKMGFKFVRDTPKGYSYKKDDKVLPRYKCQKHKLAKLLGDSFNPELTESENMKNAGYIKVFDLGHKIYELILS